MLLTEDAAATLSNNYLSKAKPTGRFSPSIKTTEWLCVGSLRIAVIKSFLVYFGTNLKMF
jgi:hypothetical protein